MMVQWTKRAFQELNTIMPKSIFRMKHTHTIIYCKFSPIELKCQKGGGGGQGWDG